MIPRSLSEKSGGAEDSLFTILGRASSMINCCLPGIIIDFDSVTQTASVQPTVRRRVRTEKGVEEIDYPHLENVPTLFLGGGAYSLTFPVQAGDECIVVFSDLCMDAWWQSGGVQGQIVARQHDLSDGFAIVGFRSKPQAIQNFNQTIPSMSDLMLAGRKMSEWMQAVEAFMESHNDGGGANEV